MGGMNTLDRPDNATDAEALEYVGTCVAERRVELGLSQAALAKAASVDAKTLRSLERGERWPQDANRAKIERALGWRPGALEILYEEETPLELLPPHDGPAAGAPLAPSPSPLTDLRRIGNILGLDTSYFEALTDGDARPALAEMTLALHRSGLHELAQKRRTHAVTADFFSEGAESDAAWRTAHEQRTRRQEDYALAGDDSGPSLLEVDDARAARRGEESQDPEDWT